VFKATFRRRCYHLAAFILLAGVLNFVLGYFLALALADPPFLNLLKSKLWLILGRWILLRFHRLTVGSAESDAENDKADLPTENAQCTDATYQELPEGWQHALQDDGVQPVSFAAGLVHFLRLEGAVYREHLLTAEARARQALAVQNPLAMEQLAADLRFINVDWSGKQRHAAELIEDRVGRLGPSEDSAGQFAELMRDQEAQIAEIDREIHSLNFRSDGTVACRRMLGEMQQLIHLAHLLRDEAQIVLATIYLQEANLDKLDRKFHYDTVNGLLGRLGIESLFAGVFVGGSRPTAVLRIAIDRFGKVNQRLGARAGDQVLKAVARFAAELAATICEKSTMARLAGSEFLLLANEATAEELTAIGEQIRQSFEAAGFNYQGTELSLSLTMSVAAIAADAGLSDIISRLDAVQEVVLRAGRNRSARWENGAAVLTLPPAIPVQARTIAVESAA
jgi:diguanylate cyclase